MLSLPPVVFGATSLGNLFRAVTDDEKSAIVRAWLGAPFEPIVIDSAGKYGAGLSLEVIGRELSKLGVQPGQVIISNKLGWRRVPLQTPEPTFEPGAWVGLEHDAVQDISYAGILRCWEEGNNLLGGYAAELVSVHDPDEYLAAAKEESERARRLEDIVGAYQALEELKRAGKAIGTGVGAKDWRIIKELHQHCKFDWVMFANSFTIMNHPPELVRLLDELNDEGVAIINSAVYHGGFLLGGNFYNYMAIDDPRIRGDELRSWRSRFQEMCRSHQVTPFEAGARFAKSHPAIKSLAFSSSRADRVASHIQVVDRAVPNAFWRDMAAAGLIDANYPYLPLR